MLDLKIVSEVLFLYCCCNEEKKSSTEHLLEMWQVLDFDFAVVSESNARGYT